MLKITVDNYDRYKRIFEILWNFQAQHLKFDPNSAASPINVLNAWELQSQSLARRGLKEGLNDTLSQMISLPNEYKNDIDSKLKAAGFETLNKLISTVKDVPIKVLKKGKIKNIDEYYIIKEVIADQAYEISSIDRERLNIIFGDFETNYGKKKNGSQ
jgi:hypothetical protein